MHYGNSVESALEFCHQGKHTNPSDSPDVKDSAHDENLSSSVAFNESYYGFIQEALQPQRAVLIAGLWICCNNELFHESVF